MHYRCCSCQQVHSVPRTRCPGCGGTEFERGQPPPAGIIESWTQLTFSGGVSTLVLIRFPDGSQSFGTLVGGAAAIGAAVDYLGVLGTAAGTQFLYHLSGQKCEPEHNPSGKD